MPKRVGFLYEQMLDKDFLKSCVKASLAKKKKKRRDVRKVVKDIDGTVDRMYQIFAGYDYTPTEPKIKMIHNMDNIIIAGRNKRKLHRAVDDIRAFMERELGVSLKGDWQVYKMYADKVTGGDKKIKRSRKLSTVGFRISRDRIMTSKRNFLRFTRQCRRAMKKIQKGLKIPVKMAQGIISRMGQLKHCSDSFNAYVKYLFPIGIGKLKKIISEDEKRRNALMKGMV